MKNRNFGDIPIGLYDIPYSPKEMVLYLNMLNSNAVIFGRSMSGKTVMVKNILARMNELKPYADIENTYILDFGGSLNDYFHLSRTCAVFNSSNEENIKRVFKAVEAKLSENSKRLAGENYIEYQEKNPNALMDHVTLVIENVTAFLAEECYSDYHEKLARIIRDGVSKGVSVLLTANDYTAAIGRLMVYFSRKFALEMPKEKYLEIFNMKIDEPMKIPGRGVTIIDSKPCEFQAYLPFKNESELKALIASSSPNAVPKLTSLPAELTMADVKAYCADRVLEPGEIIVGVDYAEHKPICLDLMETRNIAIYGKKQFGKTNLLRLILQGAMEEYPNANFCFLDDAKGQLKEFYSLAQQKVSGDHSYTTLFKEFANLLNAFSGDPDRPTFFVIQNKGSYRDSSKNRGEFCMTRQMVEARGRNAYFIFADVPKIPTSDIARTFTQFIEVAFLLDSIGDFLNNSGQSSVFSGMDAKEMKREYTRSDIGDGFYYDVQMDDLKKIKVIKKDE